MSKIGDNIFVIIINKVSPILDKKRISHPHYKHFVGNINKKGGCLTSFLILNFFKFNVYPLIVGIDYFINDFIEYS